MPFEDVLRDVTGALAMTFNPEVELTRRKMEEQKRQSAIEQLSQGIQAGAIDPAIGNQKLQQLGGQAVGPNQLTLDRQEQLRQKRAADARNEQLRATLEPAIINNKKIPEDQKLGLLGMVRSGNAEKAAEMLGMPRQVALGSGNIGSYNLATGEVVDTGEKGYHSPKGGGTGGASGKVGLTPEAIDKLADEYHQTGSLPGLGIAAKGDKEAIINRERAKYPTSTGGDMVVNRVAYKANSMGLNALTKDIVAITPYKEMLDKNVDIAIDLSKKVVMSDSKLANKSINWIKQNAADNPDTSEYLAQMRFVQTEAARVLANPRLVGQLTDTARQEMEQVISGDMPLGASTRVLQRIKKDGENRVAAMESARNELTKKLGGSTVTKETKPATKSVHWDELK